jgi:hypothetical protein
VGELEVLVGELLAVDGLSTSALLGKCVSAPLSTAGVCVVFSYVATGEVTTLKHELGDHTVELGAGVAEALLAGAESAEVLSGLGDNIIVEGEVDAAGASCEEVMLAKALLH